MFPQPQSAAAMVLAASSDSANQNGDSLSDSIKQQWKRARDDFDNKSTSFRRANTNLTQLRVPHGLEHLSIFSNDAARRDQSPSSPRERGDALMPLTPRTREKVMLFSMEKDQKIKRSLTQYDDWRKSVRDQLEQSISSKVGQRLDTPPEERLRRTKQMLKKKLEDKAKEIEVTEQQVVEKPSEEWQKRFGSASKSTFEAQGITPRPLSRLQTTYKEAKAALSDLNHNARTQEKAAAVAEEPNQYEQRVKLFSKFNKEGFRDAIRRAEVLDGPKIGQYVDVNGIVLTNHGPFWPVGFGPMVATPNHVTSSNSLHEPLWTKESNQQCSNEKASRRIVQYYSGKWQGSLLVYDSASIEPGQLVKTDEQVPPGCPPHLEFESRFESGNLHQVYRVGLFEYDLLLKPDLFTERHTQWYYFRVRRMIPLATYQFRIINFTKPDSLYNYGMRPLLYSETNSKNKEQGWFRAGHHIDYSQSAEIKSVPELVRSKNFYVLSWQVEFPHTNDTCYLAHCYPYPFTRVRNYVENLMEQTHKQKMFRREILCETRARNTCYLLTITSNQVPDSQKKTIVLTSRVHPGETNASWVLEGFLDFITSQHLTAQQLRKQYIFKVVPCLNPDGVIVGNYRCSLFGRDMNRNYRKPKREFFPTIWHVKNIIERSLPRNEVLMYVDLHGHSRRHNVFMYGCDASYLEGEAELPESYLNERLFPFLMSMKGPDLFSFSKSKFHIKKCKESTGRVVMFREYKIFNSFTMETSLSGTTTCATINQPGRHFGIHDLKKIGHVFAESLAEYSKIISDQLAQHDYILELTRVIAHQMIDQSCADTAESPNTEIHNTPSSNHSQDRESAKKQQLQQKERENNYMAAAKAEKDKAVAEVANLLNKTKNLKDCLKLLERIKRAGMSAQSDTDDSDSTSESEFLDSRSAKMKKKLKSRKKSMLLDNKKSDNGAKGDPLASKRSLASMSMYQSPYAARSGGGFPIFTEERIADRKKHTRKSSKHPQFPLAGGESTVIANEHDENERLDNDNPFCHVTTSSSPNDGPLGANGVVSKHRVARMQYNNAPPTSEAPQQQYHDTHERLHVSPEDMQAADEQTKPKTGTLGPAYPRAPSSTPTHGQSSNTYTKRSMTPVKNLFIDAFGDQAQNNLTRNQQQRSRTPINSILVNTPGYQVQQGLSTHFGAPKATSISSTTQQQPNMGESLAMKALFNGGRAIDRNNGTIISYYIKKR